MQPVVRFSVEEINIVSPHNADKARAGMEPDTELAAHIAEAIT